MSDKQRLDDALVADALFQIMPQNSQDLLRSKMHVRSYISGQNVYGFDDTPVGLYFLFEGGLRVAWPGLIDVNAAHFYSPGSWFGQLSAMTETNRLVTVTAATSASLGFVQQADLKSLMQTDIEILRHLARITQSRLKTAIEIVADLMIRDSEQRFLATIIRLSGANNPLYNQNSFFMYFSQEELARMANVSRTSANTLIKRLERKNILKVSYRRIEIINSKMLLELVKR